MKVREITEISIILILIAVLGIEQIGHAKMNIPKERIPRNIPDDVRKQIERLYSSNSLDRGHAAYLPGRIGPRASASIPFLIEMLDDRAILRWTGKPHPIPGDPVGNYTSPCDEATWALSRMGASAVKPLITAIQHRDSSWPLEWALGEIDDPQAAESLVSALRHNNERVREYSAKALGNIKYVHAVEPLIQMLKDEDEEVRANAASALGEIGDSRAVEPLIESLSDSDYEVRANVASALGEIGDSRAVEPLISALKDERHIVKSRSASALGKIRNTLAVEPLIARLKDKDENQEVRCCAAVSLGCIDDPRTIQPLLCFLKDKHEDDVVRRYAAQELANKANSPQVVGALIAALEDKDIKRDAEFALIKTMYPIVVERLIAMLKEENADVRRHAARILRGRIRDKKDIRIIEPLIEALEDENEYVRKYALRGLKNLTGKRYGNDLKKWQNWWQDNKAGYAAKSLLLHKAIRAGDIEQAELLLTEGVYINAKDENGRTPLHSAVECGSRKMAELLIDKSANVNARDIEGRTPLALAKGNGYNEVVELLRKHGGIE